MQCQNCGEELTEISVDHSYSIEWDEVYKQWVKHTSTANYVCGACGGELGISEIADILKQVDEL